MGQVLVGLVLAPDAEKRFEGAALAAFVVAGLTLYWFRRAEDRVVKVAVTAVSRRAVRADTLSRSPEILAVRRAGARTGPPRPTPASHLHPAVRQWSLARPSVAASSRLSCEPAALRRGPPGT
jgi:hypothetical protein